MCEAKVAAGHRLGHGSLGGKHLPLPHTSRAQPYLAALYYNGSGLPKDFKKAAEWYRKAAEAGEPDGQRGLAVIYYHGDGVPKDHTEAAKWYRKAAEGGNLGAQFAPGSLYLNGEGLPKDPREAAS